MGSKRSSRVCVYVLSWSAIPALGKPMPPLAITPGLCCARWDVRGSSACCVGACLMQAGCLHTMATQLSLHRLCVLAHIMSCSPQRCPDIYFIPLRVRLHLSSRSKAFVSANGHCLHRRCINPGLCITDVRLLFKCKTSYIHLLTLFRNHFH